MTKLDLTKEIRLLASGLVAEIEQGECFNKEDRYEYYIGVLDRLRTLSAIQYTENQLND